MSEFIQTLSTNGLRDDPRRWAEEKIVSQPSFDLKTFQRKIDKICGKTPEGYPIVRVSWAWDERCYSRFFIDWDASGKPTRDTLRAKYIYRTIEIDSETRVDICPPRFVFEERIEPAQYYDAWEENRWQFDETRKMRVPTRPMPPRNGYYRFLYYAASHDPEMACCRRALEAGAECFGVYRQPDNSDLTLLNKTRRIIEEEKNRPNPYQPLSAKDLENILFETERVEREKAEEKLTERSNNGRRQLAEIVKPIAAYSLPNETVTEAGIIISGS